MKANRARRTWFRFTPERIHTLAIFLILLLCYSYTFPRWADPNQNSRLDMVVAVVEDGTFQIDPYVSNTVDYARVGDHYYSDKAPGVAFLGIPIYAALKAVLDLPLLDRLMEALSNNHTFQATLREDGSGILEQKVRFAVAQVVLSFLLASVPSALLGALLFRFLGHLTPHLGRRLLVVLAYGLGTPAFAYAGALYGHQLSALLLFWAFLLAFEAGETFSPGRSLWAGLLLGYSVVTEYPAALVAGIVLLYTVYRVSRLHPVKSRRFWAGTAWLALGIALPAAGLLAYNTAIFGGPFELGYGYSELWVGQHQTGFMSLTLPHWEAIWGITFGLFRGLFVLSPLLLLAVPGFFLWWKRAELRAEFWVVVLSVAFTLWFNASSVMWWGGFAVGPRYLLPMLPFFMIPLLYSLERWDGKLIFRLILAALAAWSLTATWGLTLAEQAFPSDAIRNPLVEYALPNWQQGNLARNVGTMMGLPGVLSLLPLLLALIVMAAAWWSLARSRHYTNERIYT